jgi:uncharacterized membrane protein
MQVSRLLLLGMLVMAAAVRRFDGDNVTVTGVQYLSWSIVILD